MTQAIVFERGVPSITCPCGATQRAVAGSGSGFPPDAAARFFAGHGWRVGANAKKNRCKACQAEERERRLAARLAKKEHKEEPKVELDQPMKTEATQKDTKPMHPEITAAMASRSDRRKVIAMLNEAYGEGQNGYLAGWSDKIIAERLGVLESLVAMIRDENFGPNQIDYSEQVLTLAANLEKMTAKTDEQSKEIESIASRQKALIDSTTALISQHKERSACVEDLQEVIAAQQKQLVGMVQLCTEQNKRLDRQNQDLQAQERTIRATAAALDAQKRDIAAMSAAAAKYLGMSQ
jgi:myosin heavy subunit